MDDRLRAGIAIFNAGGYHDAHDAWEDHWLDLEPGTDDERFLHGLIQYTAAVYHATGRNWAGLQGLADSAAGYLDGLPSPYRNVALDPVRSYLGLLARDPEHVERASPPQLSHAGRALTPADLVRDADFDAAAIVATAIAASEDAFDEAVIESAVEIAQSSGRTDDGRFGALVFDFVAGEQRPVVYQRLAAHVDRRRSRERDVEGLFDPE